jgi:hypothetical protein
VRLFVLLAAFVVFGGAAACGRARGQAAPAAPEPDRPSIARAAADVDALGALLEARHRDAGLGPHRFHGSQRLVVVADGEAVETLDEDALVEQAANGDLHASYTNSREQGREVYGAGGLVWTRPRYGKFHRRPPVEPDEAARAADDIYAAFGADFALVARAAALSDGGATTAAGRPARRVALALGPARPGGGSGWRGTAEIEALAGNVTLDVATGALLEGKLAARVAFVRDGKRYTLQIDASHKIDDVGAAVAIVPPSEQDSAPTPPRSTDIEDREELLGGLAPPLRRNR